LVLGGEKGGDVKRGGVKKKKVWGVFFGFFLFGKNKRKVLTKKKKKNQHRWEETKRGKVPNW